MPYVIYPPIGIGRVGRIHRQMGADFGPHDVRRGEPPSADRLVKRRAGSQRIQVRFGEPAKEEVFGRLGFEPTLRLQFFRKRLREPR